MERIVFTKKCLSLLVIINFNPQILFDKHKQPEERSKTAHSKMTSSLFQLVIEWIK